LEPLAARHEEGLWAASQHPGMWTWTVPEREESGALSNVVSNRSGGV